MNDDDLRAKREEFFAAGLLHYGTAVRAARDFADMFFARAPELLVACAESFPRWSRAPAWRDELKTSMPRTGDVYVSFTVPGTIDSATASLELGLWWFAPGGLPVAAYGGIHKHPLSKQLRPPPSSNLSYHVGLAAYFLSPVTPERPLADTLSAICAELDAAVGAAPARR